MNKACKESFTHAYILIHVNSAAMDFDHLYLAERFIGDS